MYPCLSDPKGQENRNNNASLPMAVYLPVLDSSLHGFDI